MKILNNEGGFLGAIASYIGQKEANSSNEKIAARATDFNKSEAAKNRAFQERMSSTSYQRGMDDMTAAGLNPMLAFMQGGSTTPTGSSAQAVTAQMQNTVDGDVIEKGANSAMSYRKLKHEIGILEGQEKLLEHQALKAKHEVEGIEASNEAAKQDAQFWKENPRLRKFNNYMKVLGLGANSGMTLNRQNREMSKTQGTYGKGGSRSNLDRASKSYNKKRSFRKNVKPAKKLKMKGLY